VPFSDIDEVIKSANDSVYGLGASICRTTAPRAASDPPAAFGTVWVNTHNFIDPNMPFGGVKQSGIGREAGRAGIESYTELKSSACCFRGAQSEPRPGHGGALGRDV